MSLPPAVSDPQRPVSGHGPVHLHKVGFSSLEKPTFVDLFAGCGGLSLGLMEAGWNGLFAVEKDKDAFATLERNLMSRYDWPSWLHQGPLEMGAFVRKYRLQLAQLSGKVDLVAGGPPCQGFSLAGRRENADPRNVLFRPYLAAVKLLRPRLILIENVGGIAFAFGSRAGSTGSRKGRPYSEIIARSLRRIGYNTFSSVIRAVEFGVPQLRPRFILVGVSKDYVPEALLDNPFMLLKDVRAELLKLKKLPDRAITVREAISDLSSAGKRLVECVDSPGFSQIKYSAPKTQYQRLLHGNLNGAWPNSLRLARHRPDTVRRFEQILASCRRGVSLSDKDRLRFGISKQVVVPLDPNRPSRTLTTLPDDLLHYSEPRILTVREYARLQSFPDWFHFMGKYTTGGKERTQECPRYTQVGNAVPPFLGEALGRLLIKLVAKTTAMSTIMPLLMWRGRNGE